MKNFKRRKIGYSFFSVLLLVIILVLKIFYQNSSFDDLTWLKFNSLMGWFILIWCVFLWKKLRNEILSFYIIYFVLLYLFTFGQSLLIIFNLVHKSKDLMFRFNTYELVNAQFFTLLCLVAFHLGAIIMCKSSNATTSFFSSDNLDEKDNNISNRNIMFNAIKCVGIILFILSLPGFIYETINTLNTVMKGGYIALYGYQTGGNVSRGLIVRVFQQTSEYFIPSLICIVIGYKSSKKIRRFVFVIMTINILNGLYIGGRSEAVVNIIIIILIYHYSISPINKRVVIKLSLLSYFFISFLSVIANLRSVVNRSFTDYITTFLSSFGKESMFFLTISEIGWTMFPLGAVMKIVPNQYDFLYGKSYIYALTSIIPNLGFWDIHPAKVYAGGAQWLMDILNLWSGPAFTLIADAYRNFGWTGFFILIGFGLLFGRIFSSVDKTSIYTKPELLCSILIFFECTLISVRGDNLYIVRPLFFVVLPIYFLIKIVYSSLLKKYKIHTQKKF